MSVKQEADKNVGTRCCKPWVHHRHPALKKMIGLLLVTIGLLWLGARVGLINISWLHAVYFWPAVFIILGAWLVYRGFMREKSRTTYKERKEV